MSTPRYVSVRYLQEHKQVDTYKPAELNCPDSQSRPTLSVTAITSPSLTKSTRFNIPIRAKVSSYPGHSEERRKERSHNLKNQVGHQPASKSIQPAFSSVLHRYIRCRKEKRTRSGRNQHASTRPNNLRNKNPAITTPATIMHRSPKNQTLSRHPHRSPLSPDNLPTEPSHTPPPHNPQPCHPPTHAPPPLHLYTLTPRAIQAAPHATTTTSSPRAPRLRGVMRTQPTSSRKQVQDIRQADDAGQAAGHAGAGDGGGGDGGRDGSGVGRQ